MDEATRRGTKKELCERCGGRLDDGRGSGVMVIVPLEAHFSGEMTNLPPMVMCGYCMHEMAEWMDPDIYERVKAMGRNRDG